jgi:lipopolysaccharide export LptBFGC system permease protein LptF
MGINKDQNKQIATVLTAIATILLSGALAAYINYKAISLAAMCLMVATDGLIYLGSIKVIGVKHGGN